MLLSVKGCFHYRVAKSPKYLHSGSASYKCAGRGLERSLRVQTFGSGQRKLELGETQIHSSFVFPLCSIL